MKKLYFLDDDDYEKLLKDEVTDVGQYPTMSMCLTKNDLLSLHRKLIDKLRIEVFNLKQANQILMKRLSE